jgi:hypothetical protein
MMFEKKTLSLISKKSKGKPFESEEQPEPESSDNNLWGTHEMFNKEQKALIAEHEAKNGGDSERNARAMAAL